MELQSENGQHFKMNLTLPGAIEDNIFANGSWEPHLMRELSEYMVNGGLFLDVGANIGYCSLYIAAANPLATCISFEPHPRIYDQFIQNISINEFSNIAAHPIAISDRSGTVPFYKQDDTAYNRGLSSFIHYDLLDHELNKGYSMIEVPVVTLDSYLDDAQKRAVKVIKVDTQGYEYEVLAGAKQLIETARPVIMFEYHYYANHSLVDTINLLPQYTIYRIFSHRGGIKRFTDESDPDMHLDDFDLLCIPNEIDSSFPFCKSPNHGVV